ncbi:type II toxin-antitoxin system RelE/ParE family toxin [Candidatus Symbiopectobacterium sp. NZEC135]|uniref:type II toxin-antitoxin system RelE/ParE family toxin n=1 Tax=Candidatus Symbiopectobacterium sp. NZEC135 TaxID=2820471 RepID=UPI002226F172|nr:type II toxin-antitoxin system RelE/ParE family toxin [Candidatus Symbiopectobacterium sp. NZEC135]MCW2478526.1 type II toxin-antitoxin system RelE/ParE family toxin [Candidatus Symbiopectobacterium sp. NZEC135]
MSNSFSIVVAPLAQQCLADIESYKSGTVGAQEAANFVDNLLMGSVANIIQDPERYRFNVYLSDRGLMLRERLDVEGEYRVLYDFDGKNIEILLFVSMKQDFGRLLYRYNILK